MQRLEGSGGTSLAAQVRVISLTCEPSSGPAAGPYAPVSVVELMDHQLAGRSPTQARLAVTVLDKILQFS